MKFTARLLLLLVLSPLLTLLYRCQESETPQPLPVDTTSPDTVPPDTTVSDTTPPPVPIAAFALLTPADGATDAPLRSEFRWETAEGAAFYRLRLVEEGPSDQVIAVYDSLTTPSFTPDQDLAPRTRYRWEVTAVNADTVREARMPFTLHTAAAASPDITAYYVASDGEDALERGTIMAPFKTLAYAARQVAAHEGDTIYLAAGRYEETEPTLLPPGVHLVGAGQDDVVLSSAGVTLPDGINPSDKDFKLWPHGALIQLVSASPVGQPNTRPPVEGNQSLSGFTIDGNDKQLKAGVWVANRHRVQMHHVTIRDCAQRGAVFVSGDKPWFQAPKFYVEGVQIYDCTFINSGTDLSDESTGNLNIAQLDGAEIYNINIRDDEGYGIKFIYDGYFLNTILHHLDIELNESDAKWGEDIAVELWNAGPGNKIHDVECNTWLSIVSHPNVFDQPDSTENVEVYNVRIIDQDANSNKEGIEVGTPGVEIHSVYVQDKGIGVAIWNAGYNNVVVRNSIFYNSEELANWAGNPAIYVDNSKAYTYEKIRIINNVFDTNGYGVRIKGQNIERVEIKNNIFFNARVAEVQAVGNHIVFAHNLKADNNPEGWTTTGVTEESGNLVGDPGLNGLGERWDTYYRPATANSLGIDQGTDVGLEFKGAAPDVGYWEY
jgi:hypothetical protein